MIGFAVFLLIIGSALCQQDTGVNQFAGSAFTCPLDVDGFFPDPYQCDKYYYCRRGQLEEKLCPDGLFFDHNQPTSIESCDYPFHIDCEGDIQPSTGRGVCIFASGIFEHEDLTNCRDYYECNNNDFRMLHCPSGLFFEPDLGTCQWEFASTRTGCIEKKVSLANGFTCNDTDIQTLQNGHMLQHNRYIVADDCREFIVCENKKIPKKSGCSEGTVFSDVTLLCESPENVVGCENYYGDTIPAEGAQPARRRR